MNLLSTELKCAIVHECFEKNVSYDDCQLILGRVNAMVADYLKGYGLSVVNEFVRALPIDDIDTER